MSALVPDLAAVQVALGTRFHLAGPLRVGGQAVVFRATRAADPSGNSTSDEVAVKIYFDPSQDQRVEREIELMLQVRHVALGNLLEHQYLTINSRRYRCVIWEFVHGQALDQRLASVPVPTRVAAVVGRDTANALAAIWAKRVVHRDVNPKNIILRAGNTGSVLIDLGVAKYVDRTPLTSPGLTWGTRGYYSPEQLAGAQLTCQSDVFSLGITLQEALRGSHPTGLNQDALRNGGPCTAIIAPATP